MINLEVKQPEVKSSITLCFLLKLKMSPFKIKNFFKEHREISAQDKYTMQNKKKKEDTEEKT